MGFPLLRPRTFIALFLLWGSFFVVPVAHGQEGTGASLFLGPPAGTFAVGSTFSISLYLNTGGRYVNAVEAYLSFPPEKLQVVSSVSERKSFIEIWASPPAYSNREGTLSFQGGIHKSGIKTENGVVATILFRVKEVGAAAIKISDRSRVFLNDGTGTDVLTKTSGAVYALVLPPPAGPFVVSPTHPDQEKWYASKSLVFQWEVPPDVEGYSYALSRTPVETPDNIPEGERGTVAYDNLPDGIHYFHIKSLRAGIWGGVTHYAAKIDATPPADFKISISPSSRTSQQRPIITFDTTDVESGIDHYDLRVIRVDSSVSQASTEEDSQIPFFIETTSPYSELLQFGRYHVVVRAYDHALNYTQQNESLIITSAFLELLSGDGIWVMGKLMIPWGVILVLCLALLLFVIYLLRRIIILRRFIAAQTKKGATQLPHIAHTINTLREKQKEYHNSSTSLHILILLIVGASLLMPRLSVAAPELSLPRTSTPNPPIVNLFPQTISNEEIPYIGGYADAPGAEVIITLQRADSGVSYTHTVQTDKNGEWFHSFQQFLNPGSYQLWTQLKVGEELSVPSAQLSLSVAPTALQIGRMRVSFERLYGILFVAFTIAFLALLIATIYHARRLRGQKEILLKEIREAEESVRQGFAVLRKDIQSELAVVHQMKASRDLSLEEKLQEEKLLKDLEWATAYIEKEVWDIEGIEKKL